MGAEIAIGHSYVRGGDMPEVPPVQGGLLGADYHWLSDILAGAILGGTIGVAAGRIGR